MLNSSMITNIFSGIDQEIVEGWSCHCHLTPNASTFISKGSSLKLVMVAEGSADIYPRLAPTMEWDTAAADAVVREAGKMTYQYNPEPRTPNPEPLKYNKENLLNPWFVVKGN